MVLFVLNDSIMNISAKMQNLNHTKNTALQISTDAVGSPSPLGLSLVDGQLNIAVLAPSATVVFVCLFDAQDAEVVQVQLPQQTDGVWHGALDYQRLTQMGELDSMALRYGFRADGLYQPHDGYFYDPYKLLVDPYATELTAPFQYHADLGAARSAQIDTAALLPKAIFRPDSIRDEIIASPPTSPTPKSVYEVSVKALTQLHPDVPEMVRGTIAALREPCVLKHLQQIGVDTVELMPIAAWLDERHLPPLGLHNAWGYNPVTMMAVDPRLCPGGPDELRETVRTLYEHGIRVVLDVVFNHTAESDELGPTVSLRGLDQRYYYRHHWSAERQQCVLDNDTGCGNTLDCAQSGVIQLCLDSLRYWVTQFGISGFRFDLATILGRDANGFHTHAALLQAIEQDPVLSQVWLIAEPWDIGPNGYQLGHFSARWLEWNDRYRDTVRRFWRNYPQDFVLGEFASRITGSQDVFAHNSGQTRSINFIAAHDGMTLRDITSYERKHNDANGEYNRDGHNENYSWNHGVEGPANEAIEPLRRQDAAAMLATLFLSRGVPMFTAGDELGRTQCGNNNAYSQDNDITWLNWLQADSELAEFVGQLSRLREEIPALNHHAWLTGQSVSAADLSDARWWTELATPMRDEHWHEQSRRHIGLELFDAQTNSENRQTGRVLIWFNADAQALNAQLPAARTGCHWQLQLDSSKMQVGALAQFQSGPIANVPARSVLLWLECQDHT